MIQKSLVFIACGMAVVATAAYTGYVKSYLDDEVQTTFFMKRYPTFQMEFHDPFANEGDDMPINKLPLSDKRWFSAYCKYRFGINDQGLQSLETCKSRILKYLR